MRQPEEWTSRGILPAFDLFFEQLSAGFKFRETLAVTILKVCCDVFSLLKCLNAIFKFGKAPASKIKEVVWKFFVGRVRGEVVIGGHVVSLG